MKVEQTTQGDSPNRRPVIAAAVAASLLMLASGLTYHTLAARLAAPVTTRPIAPEAMKEFPMQIGGWTGQEVPLDEAIVRRTHTDAHINRQYSRHNGLESVSLYVACGVKARDLMVHRPEVCYVGAGWTRTDRRSLDLPLSDGRVLPCNAISFSRGTLDTTNIVVLDYYIVDGEYCRDISLLRSKVWQGSGAVRYVAQVQIAAPIADPAGADSAVRVVSDFAVDSASSIAGLFEHIDTDLSEDSPNEPQEGR
jgi:EpsI family protein